METINWNSATRQPIIDDGDHSHRMIMNGTKAARVQRREREFSIVHSTWNLKAFTTVDILRKAVFAGFATEQTTTGNTGLHWEEIIHTFKTIDGRKIATRRHYSDHGFNTWDRFEIASEFGYLVK